MGKKTTDGETTKDESLSMEATHHESISYTSLLTHVRALFRDTQAPISMCWILVGASASMKGEKVEVNNHQL